MPCVKLDGIFATTFAISDKSMFCEVFRTNDIDVIVERPLHFDCELSSKVSPKHAEKFSIYFKEKLQLLVNCVIMLSTRCDIKMQQLFVLVLLFLLLFAFIYLTDINLLIKL